MPALIAQIVAYIQLAIKAAPGIAEVYAEGKNLIQSLFSSGLITKEQQDALMSWADEHQAAVIAGDVPPELKF